MMKLDQRKLDYAIDLYKFELKEGASFLEAHATVQQDIDFNYFEHLMFRSFAYDYLLSYFGEFRL